MNAQFSPEVFKRKPGKSLGSKILLIILQVVCLVIVVGAMIFFMLSDHDDADLPGVNAQKIRIWAKMDPLPEGSSGMQVSMPDENDYRAFILIFSLPTKESFDVWIRSSPGTKEVKPKMEDVGVFLYDLPAKEPTDRNAQIRYYKEMGTVEIRVSATKLNKEL